MKVVAITMLGAIAALFLGSNSDPPVQRAFPRIAACGGVTPVPGAIDPPRPVVQIVFDIASDSPPEAAHQGLDAVARYVNLHVAAGRPLSGLKAVAVLHGGATKAALADSAYEKHLDTQRNPNLELIRELRSAGVEVLVCGQSLARDGYDASQVTADVGVAVSAMTVVVNRQQDGFAVVTIR